MEKVTALVTGSSGGIGSAITKLLVQSGYQVLGLDQRKPEFELENFFSVELDLASTEEIDAALAQRQSPIGVVIHCAAEQPTLGAGHGGLVELWARAYAVNVLALEHIVSATRDELEATKPSRVIAIGSVHDKVTSNKMAPYSTSKAALAAWVRAAALDLATHGIAAIGISAGAVDSPKLREGLKRFEDTDQAMENLIAKLPAGRLVSPGEVAELVLFLLSPAGHHFTGSNIRYDSGVSGVLASE
jgi:NAD(P)-dependent dehydrogenase (short-subunit alcohol dehydrogenase family)